MTSQTKLSKPRLAARMAALGVAGLVAAAVSGCAQLPDQGGSGGYSAPNLSALPPLNVGLGYNARTDNVGVGVGTGFGFGPLRLGVGAWY